MSSSERSDKINTLLDTVAGKIAEVGLKHDASRAIQIAIKHADEGQKLRLVKELTGHFRTLAGDHYGHYIVIKMLSNDTRKGEAKKLCLAEFKGHVNKVRAHYATRTLLFFFSSFSFFFSFYRADLCPFRTLGFCIVAAFSQGMHVDIHNAER